MCYRIKLTDGLRRCYVSPVNQGLPIRHTLASEGAITTRKHTIIAVTELIKGSSLDDGDGASMLLNQSCSYGKTRGTTSNDNVVVRRIVAGGTK